MGNKINTVVILGGGLVKENGVWRTTNFKEEYNFNALGDRLRVVAGHCLFSENPKVLVIVLGGKGKLKDIKDAPNVSSVIKDELISLGVSEKSIITENNSDNTFEQLYELINILKNKKLQCVVIISNRYHLPRVKAMLKYLKDLNYLYKMLKSSLVFNSAENILLKYDKEKWQDVIEKAYGDESMRKRNEIEKIGVRQLKDGSYKIKPKKMGRLNIRKAEENDLEFVFSLRNEEQVRQASFNSNPIKMETHRRWFSKVLKSNNSFVFIAELNNKPIGQVRYDLMGRGAAEANIAITQNCCGQGYGTEILKKSAKKFFDAFPAVQKLHAFIKPNHRPSIRSFEKAGYEFYRNAVQKEHKCVEMIFTRCICVKEGLC